MSDFTYDGAEYDGGTYDEDLPATSTYLEDNPYDGAHWDGDPASGQTWLIGDNLLNVYGVTLTPTTLSLDIRARSGAERSALDELDTNAGAVETRERADGTVRGLDTAGGANTYSVRPPTRLRPPRVVRNWLVDDVTRDRTSADTTALEATVSLVAEETRAPGSNYSNTGTGWTFAFSNAGTLVTDRVGQIQQGPTTTIPIVLTPRQAELLETVLAATAGAVVSPVPDGETFSRDTTPTDRQTVTISLPSGVTDAAIDPGDYVVEDWDVTGDDGGAYRMRIEISTRFEV